MTCAKTGSCRLGSHTYAWPCVYAPGARPPAPPPAEPDVTHGWDEATGRTSCCGRLRRELGVDAHITNALEVTCEGGTAVPADRDAALVGRVATALGRAVTGGKTQQTWLSRHDLRALAAAAVQEAGR